MMRSVFWFSVVTGIIVLFFSSSSWAGLLTFGSEFRLRYEFQHHFNQKYFGDDPPRGSSEDGFLLGRLRAGFDWMPSDRLHCSLWLQDSEAWDVALSDGVFYDRKFGLENNPNKDRWELGDAFVDVKALSSLPLTVKVGRQRIAYGNNRVFGPGEWGNTGRWIWDAAKASYTLRTGFIDAFYGRTMLHEPNTFSLSHRHGFEGAAVYGRFQLERFGALYLEPFGVSKVDDHERYKGENSRLGDFDSWYLGTRTSWSGKNSLDVDCTLVVQQGDYSEDDIDAYGYHCSIGYSFKNRFRPKISIAYSYASGDSNPEDGDHETFDGVFGARDKMYGRMNLFQWMNLKDTEIDLELRPKPWLYVKVEYHRFGLAERKDAWYLNPSEYRDPTGKSGKEVGEEVDLVTQVSLPHGDRFEFGLGRFWPDEFAKKQASSEPATWLFFQWSHECSFDLVQ